MTEPDVYSWVVARRAREDAVLAMDQPLTAKQLGQRLGIHAELCSGLLLTLKGRGVARCLTPRAPSNRIYWLTRRGIECQRRLCEKYGRDPIRHRHPKVDWMLYAQMCFSHRAVVIKAMNGWMRPPQIRRRARLRTPGLRMSRSNCRDVLRQMLARSVVRIGRAGKISFPHYSLTEVGHTIRSLLHRAELTNP